MTYPNPLVDRYLQQFRAGLPRLPAAERTELVQEIESQPSLRHWLHAAGMLAGFSLASLFVIPMLGILGIAVPFFAAIGFIGNIVQYFYPPAGQIVGTHIPGAGPVTTLVVGEITTVALFALGLGAFVLLKRYVRMLISSVRKAWAS